MEEWKIIPGFTKYQASTLGNIKNIKTQKLLKITPKKDGYVYLGLCNDSNNIVQRKVHRLITLTFLNNPENKKTVNHKNKIRHDNKLCNLEWFTQKEQNNHKGKSKSNTGIIIQCYNLQNIFIQEFKSIADGGRFLDLKRSEGIIRCCKGKINNYKGYIWKYKDINHENEIWKEITINNAIFSVSNKGRIKSKKNIITYGSKIDNGYLRGCSNDNNKKTVKIFMHNLVAKAFLSIPIDINKIIVNHIDGNKQNNQVKNLEWVTQKENVYHAINILKVGIQRKVQQINKDTLEVIKEFQNIIIAAKETKSNNTSITHVCKGKYKTANGFVWKYI